MGMLQLAGAVSGFGKGLQQGLQQTQQYMSQSLLLEERDRNERERMKLTFGHDEGMLQKRAKIEAGAAELAYSRQLDRDEQRQDFEVGENRKSRQADREKAEQQVKAQQERDERQQQNTVTNKVLDASYAQQSEATKAKQDRAKEERDRAAKREEQQANIGKEIVTETIRNQRPHAGGSVSAKLDPTTNAQLTIYKDRIGRLEDEMNNVMTTKERRMEIQKEIAKLEEKQNALIGIQSSARERPQYRFPE